MNNGGGVSGWSQHRAANGLIYLWDRSSDETKWLWSRHCDPASGQDYLVNTVSGERTWVTKDNQHLCPVRAPSTTAGATGVAATGGATTAAAAMGGAAEGVSGAASAKLRALGKIQDDARQKVGKGPHEMDETRTWLKRSKGAGRGRRDEHAQRLLELGEFLTQQMIKADEVQSDGLQAVRRKRKEVVDEVWRLIDEVERLKKLVPSSS